MCPHDILELGFFTSTTLVLLECLDCSPLILPIELLNLVANELIKWRIHKYHERNSFTEKKISIERIIKQNPEGINGLSLKRDEI